MTIISKVKSKLVEGLLPLSVSAKHLKEKSLTPRDYVEMTIADFNRINTKKNHLELLEIVSETLEPGDE